MTARWVVVARRIYRLCLIVYPRGFRAAHAASMTLLFGDICADTARRRGILGLIALWARTVVDLAINGVGERLRRVPHLDSRRLRPKRRNWIGDVARDIAFAGRTARRQPGLLTAATVTLAIGIGANVSIFTFVNGVLLRPLRQADSDRLMMVTAIRPDGRPGQLGYRDVAGVAADDNVFAAFAGYSSSRWDLAGVREPDRVEVATVTADFFGVLQWVPAMGRVWTTAEEGPNQPRVAVLTEFAWRRRFAGDPAVVGTVVQLDDTPHTIVGVLGSGVAVFPNRSVEFFVPPRENFGVGAFWLSGIGRLQDDVAIERAQAALNAVARQLAAEYPDVYANRRFAVSSLQASLVEHSRQALVMLFASVVLVLLVAVANVTNLLLTRSIGRTREFAIRTALGAGRSRIVQQMLVEGLLIGFLGGLAGLMAAVWVTKGLLFLGPENLPRRDEIVLDPVVASFAFGLSVVIGLVVGMVSAVRIVSSDPSDTLREGGVSGPSVRGGWRHALTVVQVAVAFVLLAGAGLLLKSFWTLTRIDPGFATEHLVSFRLSLPRSQFPDRGSIAAFHRELRSGLSGIPGTTALASVSLSPFESGNLCNSLSVAGRQDEVADCVEFRSASIGYFDVLGMPLVRGRAFNDGDAETAPPRAVVNQRLADLAWPGQDPVGQRFTMWDEYPNTTVVGVVSDIHQFGLDRDPVPEVYMAQAQFPFRYARYMLRTNADVATLAAPLRNVIWGINPAVPIYDFTTMDDLITNSISEPRFRTIVLGGFAIVALMVALAGVVAVVAYNVRVETREIGLRLALGASGRRVVSELLSANVRLVALGLAIGAVGALGGLRVLRGFLFGVTTFDVVVMVGSIVLLGGLGTIACFVPARAASRVDPMISLRS